MEPYIFTVLALYQPYIFTALALYRALNFDLTPLAGLRYTCGPDTRTTYDKVLTVLWLLEMVTVQGKQGTFPVRENKGNLEILSKHREFCQNTRKTQGIFFAQVVNALILKVKDIAIFAAKKSLFFFSRSWIGLPSQFCVCYSHKLCKLTQGKFAVRQGKHREF